jgi:lysyl-tRNA synthetase class 2
MAKTAYDELSKRGHVGRQASTRADRRARGDAAGVAKPGRGGSDAAEAERGARENAGRSTSERRARRLVWRARIAEATVWYCRLIAVLCIVSAVSARFNDVLDLIPDDVYLSIWFALGVPSLGFGTLSLMLAAALRRRKRSAWYLLTGQLVLFSPLITYAIDQLAVGSQDIVPLDQLPVLVLLPVTIWLVLIGLLIWAYPEFPAKGDPSNPWFALTVGLCLMALSAVLGTTLVAATDQADNSIGERLLYTVQRGLAGTGLPYYNSGVQVDHAVNVLLNFLGSALVLLTAYAFFRPRRHAAALSGADEQHLRHLLAAHGDGDSLGYFALRRDKTVIFSPTRKAAIAYRVVGGVSLAGGDPIGDPEAWPGAIEAWIAEAQAHAWVPAVMGASERAGRVYERFGLDALELGDEAIVEAAGFTLQGRAMRVVRQAYNRVARAGYTTRVRRHADISADQMAELVDLADRWREGGPERGFSMALSRLGDARDGECVMVECLDARGVPRALLSFVPWGTHGLSLDLMRREHDSDNGLIEFMVIETLRRAKELGVERLSLNFAMFRSVFERGSRLGAGPFLRLWRHVLLFFSKWWQIESLYRANAKYRPTWAPRYVCFPAASDLLRIGLAAARAEGFVVFPTPRPVRRFVWRVARRSRLLRAGVRRWRAARA